MPKEKKIQFSPPDISEAEINEVVDTLRSGWITTGPKTKLFEQEICRYTGAGKTICLNSATAGLELVLRLLEIGPGDEVITTPYTFAATANVIIHVGAKPVFVDIKDNEFNIDPEKIAEAVTSRTKAVIPVDFGGWPCDYNEIKSALDAMKKKYHPRKNTLQTLFERPVILADAAHSFGSSYCGNKVGTLADFTVFSFHAVKNITTAEGGAVSFNSFPGLDGQEIYRRLQLLSLHGQSKDALAKMNAGGWFYTIDIPGYKNNMTDIAASIGLAQLRRFDSEILSRRKVIYDIYNDFFKAEEFCILPGFESSRKTNNYHIFPLRIMDCDETKRAGIINKMADMGISLNVHFIPVVTHPAYKKLGYKINDFPNTLKMYINEISLPLYSTLTSENALYVAECLKDTIIKINKE